LNYGTEYVARVHACFLTEIVKHRTINIFGAHSSKKPS